MPDRNPYASPEPPSPTAAMPSLRLTAIVGVLFLLAGIGWSYAHPLWQLIPGAAVAYLVLGSVIIYEQARLPLISNWAPYASADHDSSVAIDAYLASCGAALQQQGFHQVGGPIQSVNKQACSCAAVYESDVGEIAQVTVVYVVRPRATSESVLLLHTRLANGMERHTGNGKKPGVFPRRKGHPGETFPDVTDAASLIQIHRALVARDGVQPERYPTLTTPKRGSRQCTKTCSPG